LQRKHKPEYEKFLKEKQEKKLDRPGGKGQMQLTNMMLPTQSPRTVERFSRSDTRQLAISNAIAKMIIKDLTPIRIVECEGFRDLLTLVEPRYKVVSRSHIRGKLLPQYQLKVEEAIVAMLQGVESCNVTIDIWSSRRMHGYLGVTCHFLTRSWQLESVLLCCSHLQGRHTGANILAEFEEVAEKYSIVQRIFRVIADNASNMKKAFPETVSLPGFDVDDDEEDLIDTGNLSDSEEGDDDFTDLSLVPKRINCFAHTLQLCVKDGLASSSILSKVLARAAKVVNHIKKSTLATEKMEKMFGKTVIPRNETRWNSQLKMIRRLVEVNTDEVVEKPELKFTSHEKVVMKEMIQILEPFEEATDLTQGDQYVSISLVIPSVVGLQKHLSQVNSRYLSLLVRKLKTALDERLGHVEDECLYLSATILDPRFKLAWHDPEDTEGLSEAKKTVLEAVVSLTPNGADPAETQPISETESYFSSDVDSAEPPKKKSKLFSFMKTTPIPKKRKTCSEELEAYCREDIVSDVDPLMFWKKNSREYPSLARLAQRVLAVPATSGAVERVFSQAGKILRPDRSRLLPNNLETLIFLKTNSQLL